jgi:hypothetical protein
MKLRYLIAMLALAMSRPAAAESHKLLVLQSEGRADAATRAKIDAALLRLALTTEPQASAGELNYTDAATAVGCKPEAAACKDEVLGMLAVDEIVITTVTPKPGGVEVAVRRVTKGGATRDMSTLLPAGTPPDKLDGLAPLFGAKPVAPGPSAAPAPVLVGPPAAPPAGPPAAPPPASRPAAPPPAAVTTSGRPTAEPPVIPAPTTVKQEPLPPPVARPVGGEQANVQPMDESSTRRHRLEVAGMAGGGGMVVLGLLFWGAANSVQGDIDKAPATTKQNLVDLKNLEAKGDAYAGLGNLLTISGLVIGGLGTYFYIKDHRAASTTSARLMPTVLDHGAGLVFTIGGSP